MQSRAKSLPLWFFAPFVPMVISQIIRLFQTESFYWLLCDYSGRIGALLVLAAIPAARAIAFRRQPLRTTWWETTAWIIGLPLLYCTVCQWLSHAINHLIPHTTLGLYPWPTGWLNIVDLTFGVTLVAYHEEIVFRRCGQEFFDILCAKPTLTILGSALLFAAYHWTTGLGNMTATFLFGLGTMIALLRMKSLWPLVLAHFLTDFAWFAGMF